MYIITGLPQGVASSRAYVVYWQVDRSHCTSRAITADEIVWC